MASNNKKRSQIDSGIKLVVVESPTKAKTIRKFLGQDYIVESCMGHIRDLPQSSKDIPEKFKKEKWAQLGVNVDKEFEPLYCIPKDKNKVVKNLKDKLQDASELYLATDEDREGESISWHLVEVLKPHVPTKRMVFHEITKEAIQKSLKETREIDSNLVKAQEARRVLDRLVGYSISPLLWKKIAYGLSAGRVQSVAVRLISEKEIERLKFKKSSYSGVTVQLEKDKVSFEARLHLVKSQRVATGKDFNPDTGLLNSTSETILLDRKKADEIAKKIDALKLIVDETEEKPVHRKPSPPFITSTLQQESNRKLGLSSRETMQVAQKLYEQGYITYMRTDSTFLSQEAIQAARKWISKEYGQEYLPGQPRTYEGKKAKGAQEAHEAIRPAGAELIHPAKTDLSGQQLKLYELIWMRTVASQMVDARQKQVSVKLKGGDYTLSASGMTIEFPGYLRAYVEGQDDPDAELAEKEVRLPQFKKGDEPLRNQIEVTDHETKPPARFTEASLVQKMEKEGIGRPSTYASIIGTIIDRGYVRKNGSALVPTFTAMVVSKLLRQHLPEFVDLGFTSEMEQSLDTIAEGDLDWVKFLKGLYHGPKGLKAQIEKQEKQIDPEQARSIEFDNLPGVRFHVGKYGAYLTTKKDGESVNASIPDAEAPADMTMETVDKIVETKLHGQDSLGKDPNSQNNVYVLSGRYGPYVQLGENDAEPKRVSLPQGMEPTQVDLKQALQLLELPKVVGSHPVSGKEIKVGIGRFGPYVVHEKDYRSIPKGQSLFTVSFEDAMKLLSAPKKGRGGRSALKVLGKYPGSDEEIQLFNGPYGPYVKMGKTNASLPEGVQAEQATLEQAIEVLSVKVGSSQSSSKTKSKKAVKKAKPKQAPSMPPPTKMKPQAEVRLRKK
ncbi:MAG: type I DNA topoisomerase [Bdellovibrionales bacterium]